MDRLDSVGQSCLVLSFVATVASILQ